MLFYVYRIGEYMEEAIKLKEQLDYFHYDRNLIEKFLQNLNLEQLEQLKAIEEEHNNLLKKEINSMSEEKDEGI